MTTYTELNKILQSLLFAKPSRFNLSSIQKHFDALKLKEIPYIHIAGTNGKGSSAQKISSALTLSGYKCGRYTSPHLATFRERITVDETLISQKEVEKLLPPLLKLGDLTFFEVTTLLAFKFFSEQNVDVAVIEVGLGGRLDATNCIHPILSVITSIGHDHEHLLGNTLEEIASEKAGIIKPLVPVVLGPTVTQKSVEMKAQENKAPIHRVEGEFESYDLENQAIVKAALDALKTRFTFKEKAIDESLLKKPPCRFEKIHFEKREILLDMSHNLEGFIKLFSQINKEYPNRKLIVFFNLSLGHSKPEILRLIEKHQDELFLLKDDHPRLEDTEKLSHELKVPCEIIETKRAKKHVLEKESSSLFLFTGSIFFMKTIKELFGQRVEEDPYPIFYGSASFLSTSNKCGAPLDRLIQE